MFYQSKIFRDWWADWVYLPLNLRFGHAQKQLSFLHILLDLTPNFCCHFFILLVAVVRSDFQSFASLRWTYMCVSPHAYFTLICYTLTLKQYYFYFSGDKVIKRTDWNLALPSNAVRSNLLFCCLLMLKLASGQEESGFCYSNVCLTNFTELGSLNSSLWVLLLPLKVQKRAHKTNWRL